MPRKHYVVAFFFCMLLTGLSSSFGQVVAPNVGTDDENTLILSLPAGAAATLQNAPSAQSAATTIGVSLVMPRRFYLGATFNVGSTSSTIVGPAEAALFLLEPSGMGNSFGLCGYYYPLRGRLWQMLPWGLGLALDAGAGGGILAGEVAGVPSSDEIVSLYGLLGVQGQFGPVALEMLGYKNLITIGLNLAGGVRAYAGNAGLSFNDGLRLSTIGTIDILFAEVLAAAFLQINGTQGFARLTYIPTDQPLKGLSGLQMSIGVRIETALIQGVLKATQ